MGTKAQYPFWDSSTFHCGMENFAVEIVRRKFSDAHRNRIDMRRSPANNREMARPEVAHRIKSYSAATGFVYQYQFLEVQKARRGLSLGTEYVYAVSVDRKENFPLTVFVKQSAEDKWAKREGRKLSGTEEYAVAKVRLFQAFDEVEDLPSTKADLLVDDTNLDELLKQLDL